MLRELSDRVFRTREQIESLLQTGCIALVPLVEGAVATETGSTIANEKRLLACRIIGSRLGAAEARSIRCRKRVTLGCRCMRRPRFAQVVLVL